MSRVLAHREISPRRPNCLAAQRGFELLNPETRGKRWGDWHLIFIAERSGLPRRLERHCAVPRYGPIGPIRDPTPLAMVPLRGFGGDGAWCRCTRKGSSNVAISRSSRFTRCGTNLREPASAERGPTAPNMGARRSPATAIVNGRKPPQLTAQTLMRLTPRLPAGWAEQRKLLGFL
jgi:hypothetical protein